MKKVEISDISAILSQLEKEPEVVILII